MGKGKRMLKRMTGILPGNVVNRVTLIALLTDLCPRT